MRNLLFDLAGKDDQANSDDTGRGVSITVNKNSNNDAVDETVVAVERSYFQIKVNPRKKFFSHQSVRLGIGLFYVYEGSGFSQHGYC